MGYYIGIDGVQQGPFELNDLPGKGLRADSLVWTDGMPDWKRADQVAEVAALLAPLPPAPVVAPPPAVMPPHLPPQHNSLPKASVPGMPSTFMPRASVPPPQQNGMAIASLVLGVMAFPLMCAHGLGFLASLLAVVFGFIARSRAKREHIGGEGMALAGIILGMVPAALFIVFLVIAMTFMMSSSSRWH